MTALQSIIKEAQALRKKSPKMEWKKAVAQASAIYASKHKGKSPVGKKKTKKVGAVKKAAKKHTHCGKVKKYVRKDGRVKSHLRKVSGVGAVKKSATTMHKDTKSHNVNIKVMSGVSDKLINSYKDNLGKIRYYETTIDMFRKAIKEHKQRNLTPQMVLNLKKDIKKFSSLIKELKTHARELKKHI